MPNPANTGETRPILMALINKIAINQKISYWPNHGSRTAILAFGIQPRDNTPDLGPVTGSSQNSRLLILKYSPYFISLL